MFIVVIAFLEQKGRLSANSQITRDIASRSTVEVERMCAELDRERAALLLEVSRMYWEEQLDQRTIAQRAGYSRPTVSRMLAEARREGIVTIVVAHPVERLMRLEERLKSAFGLVQARVTQDVPDSLVPTGGNSTMVLHATTTGSECWESMQKRTSADWPSATKNNT